MQNVPVIKTLVTSLHDLHVCQRAELGQKGAAAADLWDSTVSQHSSVMVVKHAAQRRALVLHSSGGSDILKGTMADRLSRGQARSHCLHVPKRVQISYIFLIFAPFLHPRQRHSGSR